MTTSTRRRSREVSGPCGCGTAHPPSNDEPAAGESPETDCGALTCAQRPRFFCGQLLADHDLTAIVDWTGTKLRLQRFVAGWGVACGLDVRCDADNPQGVVVGQGYAVSCCGDDIVICHDEPLDLSAACRTEDPCEALEDIRAELEERRERERVREELIEAAEEYADEESSGIVEALCRRLSDEEQDNDAVMEPVWVDVYLTYAEHEADLRATLAHSDCAEPTECEAARTKEGFTLTWRAGGPLDPSDHAVDAWCRGYRRCLDVLRRFEEEHGSASDDYDGLRRWLLAWIDRHPPVVFCDLRDLVCAFSREELADRYLEVLGKLVIECRVAYARGDCHSCECDRGVPLARVHLGQVSPDSPCRVRFIDTHPPFRRPLERTTLPAPIGSTNVAALVGARWREACRTLAVRGIEATRQRLDDIDDARSLLERLDCDCGPIVECGASVTVFVADLGDEPWHREERVIGFCTEAWDGIEVEESLDEQQRQIEAAKLDRVENIGPATADRLLDRGLTMSVIATAAVTRPERIVERVEAALPKIQRPRAGQLVRDIRTVWEAEREEGSG